jgi:hypothetical protein
VHYPEPPQPVPGSITNPAPPRDRVAEDMAQITPAGYQGNDPNGGVPLGSDEGSYADTDPAALTEFREPLAPYGTWVDDPTHGTVWVPHTEVVGNDFVPYQTAGHWTYDDEYVWVSDPLRALGPRGLPRLGLDPGPPLRGRLGGLAHGARGLWLRGVGAHGPHLVLARRLPLRLLRAAGAPIRVLSPW